MARLYGRIGNFINAEAYGIETLLPWRMQIGGGAAVHPTFLYEMLVTLAIFIILAIKKDKRKFKGEYTYIYFIIYGLGRMLIEGLRTDSLMLGPFRISQILSGALFLGFGVAYIMYNVKCRMYNGGKNLPSANSKKNKS